MRIAGICCRSFVYTLVSSGPCAVEPGAAADAARAFFDCLLLRVVVEPGDRPLIAADVRALRGMYADSAAACVVITGTPLGRTPDVRSEPAARALDILGHVADTLDVLADLADQLEERGERVHLMPFGWNVRWRARIPTRPWKLPTVTISTAGDMEAVPPSDLASRLA